MLEAMAQRIENAHNNFAETLMELGGIDRETAAKVSRFYVQKKLAWCDAGIGRIQVKHGGYLDRDVIEAVARKVSE